MMKITLSEIDRNRFGIAAAKVQLDEGDDVAGVLEWCSAEAVQFLIARCRGDDIALVQQMEKNGFFLTDTLIYYRNKTPEAVAVLPDGYIARAATASDADAVEQLATQTFSGYAGHYHADPHLDKADADAVYSSWAGNSCRDKSVADEVILITHGDDIAAFATLKKVEDYMLEGVLFGVSPQHQGKGLYNALMALAQQWALQRKFTQMIVSTQITNLAVQKVWCRQGFEPFKTYYTFHKWFAK